MPRPIPTIVSIDIDGVPTVSRWYPTRRAAERFALAAAKNPGILMRYNRISDYAEFVAKLFSDAERSIYSFASADFLGHLACPLGPYPAERAPAPAPYATYRIRRNH